MVGVALEDLKTDGLRSGPLFFLKVLLIFFFLKSKLYLVHFADLTVGALDLLEQGHVVPEATTGHNGVVGKQLHAVDLKPEKKFVRTNEKPKQREKVNTNLGVGLLLRRLVSPDHFVLVDHLKHNTRSIRWPSSR